MSDGTANLAETMRFISERYTFTKEHYPELRGVTSPEEILRFAVRHSALHMSKSLGKISAEAERADHGEAMSREVLEVATVKMLVNVLKLADELGLSAEDLLDRVPRVMTSA